MTRLLSASRLGVWVGLVLAVGACGTSSGNSPATGGSGALGEGASGGSVGNLAGTGSTTGGSTGQPGGGAGAGNLSGSSGVGGSTAGTSGAAGSGGEAAVVLPPLVTSTTGAYWKTDGTLADSTAAATVTINTAMTAQKWDGFGGAFNELGWSFLTTPELQSAAVKLLFSAAEGANFLWGRIPMGASDYAMDRYTLDATPSDPVPSGETNRPKGDPELAGFSLTRDSEKLIPYIKAAQAVKPDLRFWASPWTPPVWMKTGFKTNSGADQGQNAKRPSFFDGGRVSDTDPNLTANLAAYAKYYTKFVQGYKALGVNIELVSPQNEPGYDQNYPSALWDAAAYTTWIGKHLGPAMQALNIKVMLGTLSNNENMDVTDLKISAAVLANAEAKGFVSVAGVQWGVLDAVVAGTRFGDLPIWATEHKCGNYPWCNASNKCPQPDYVSTQAPNDQAYGVESWGYLRDAITKGKVTSYSAWNMVLDKHGLGIDTTREWKQNALLVVDAGKVNPTPAYYVFRHLSQYVVPGATVVGTTGGDAVAFKNPDGSLVAVVFNGGAANGAFVVDFGGKKLQFAMPASGWATVKYKP